MPSFFPRGDGVTPFYACAYSFFNAPFSKSNTTIVEKWGEIWGSLKCETIQWEAGQICNINGC